MCRTRKLLSLCLLALQLFSYLFTVKLFKIKISQENSMSKRFLSQKTYFHVNYKYNILFVIFYVPCQVKELLTLGEFCFTMIGRADIEGSKNNVAMNACAATEASYLCGWWGWSSWTGSVGRRTNLTFTPNEGVILVSLY